MFAVERFLFQSIFCNLYSVLCHYA